MYAFASVLGILILDTSLAVPPPPRAADPLPALLTQRAYSLRVLEQIVGPLGRDRRTEARRLQRRGSDGRWLELTVYFVDNREAPLVDHYVFTRANGRAATLSTLRERNRVSRTVTRDGATALEFVDDGSYYYLFEDGGDALRLEWFTAHPRWAWPERSAADEKKLIDTLVAVARGPFTREDIERRLGPNSHDFPSALRSDGLGTSWTYSLHYSYTGPVSDVYVMPEPPVPLARLARAFGIGATRSGEWKGTAHGKQIRLSQFMIQISDPKFAHEGDEIYIPQPKF